MNLFRPALVCPTMHILKGTMTGPKTCRECSAVVAFRDLKFYITEQPSEHKMTTFVQQLKEYGVCDLVRVGGKAYCTDELKETGINVVDLHYDDGTSPSDSIVKEWLKVVKPYAVEQTGGCVAVHCKSGLGRAPLLVAIALMEMGLKYEDAVLMIREQRPGAINSRQLDYLSHFRRKSRLSSKAKCVGCFSF